MLILEGLFDHRQLQILNSSFADVNVRVCVSDVFSHRVVHSIAPFERRSNASRGRSSASTVASLLSDCKALRNGLKK